MLIRLSPKPPSVKLTSGVCRTGSSKLRYLTHFLCMLFKLRDHIIFNMQSLKHRCNNPGSCKLYINFFSIFNYIFFSIRLLSVLRSFSFGFFIPATTVNDLRLRRISIPDLIHNIIFLSYFLRKSQYFPFQFWVPNKGTTGTIFITSLVWRSPWLGIEHGTSHTRSQHSTTRLSRRQRISNNIYKFITWQMMFQM